MLNLFQPRRRFRLALPGAKTAIATLIVFTFSFIVALAYLLANNDWHGFIQMLYFVTAVTIITFIAIYTVELFSHE